MRTSRDTRDGEPLLARHCKSTSDGQVCPCICVLYQVANRSHVEQKDSVHVLTDFPVGYCLFVHLKGPVNSPRNDLYLCGVYNTICLASFAQAMSDIQVGHRVFDLSMNSFPMRYRSCRPLARHANASTAANSHSVI